MGEARSALLIGVGRYDNSADLKSLDGPRVDVQSMRAVLEDPAVGGYRVQTLEDVDSNTACGQLEDFLRDRSENETCLLYFSGHGFIDANGSLYLCTTNASFKRPKTSTIPANFVSSLIDECQSKRVVLLLDCCYSGNYDGSAKSADVVQPAFSGTGFGRVVLTAGAENQLAWDNGDKGSLFSRHIAEGIRSGAADTDGDGRITVSELYDYVYRKVVNERPSQRPGKTTYRESGPSFLVAESPKKQPKVLPDWIKQELASPFAETRLNAVTRIEDFVRENSWARETVLAVLRPLMDDDSVRVQRAAHGLLGRLGAGGPMPWPVSTPAAPSAAPPVEKPATIEKPPRPVGPRPDDREEFSLTVEFVVWLVCAVFGTLFLLVLPARSDVFVAATENDKDSTLYLCAAIFLVLYSSFIALRYRSVPDVAGLFKSIAWWTGTIALAVGYLLISFRLDAGTALLSFFVLSYVGVAALVMVALRVKVSLTIGISIPVSAAWLFGLIIWPLSVKGSDQTLVFYFVASALVFGLGSLARLRYVKTHGR